MKTQRLWFTALLFGAAACTAAPRPAPAPVPVDRTAAEREVRAALDQFFVAAERHDWPTIHEMLAPDFEFYTDAAVVYNREDYLEAVEGDPMVVHRLDLGEPRIALSADGSLAWVKYHLSMDAEVSAGPFSMNSVETVVFRKDGGRWRMTHSHASMQTLDP